MPWKPGGEHAKTETPMIALAEGAAKLRSRFAFPATSAPHLEDGADFPNAEEVLRLAHVELNHAELLLVGHLLDGP